MEYIISRNFRLPETSAGFARDYHFNLWGKRLWPYNALEAGDTLYWYETPTASIVWKTRGPRKSCGSHTRAN